MDFCSKIALIDTMFRRGMNVPLNKAVLTIIIHVCSFNFVWNELNNISQMMQNSRCIRVRNLWQDTIVFNLCVDFIKFSTI